MVTKIEKRMVTKIEKNNLTSQVINSSFSEEKIINLLMKDGEKAKASRLFYSALTAITSILARRLEPAKAVTPKAPCGRTLITRKGSNHFAVYRKGSLEVVPAPLGFTSVKPNASALGTVVRVEFAKQTLPLVVNHEVVSPLSLESKAKQVDAVVEEAITVATEVEYTRAGGSRNSKTVLTEQLLLYPSWNPTISGAVETTTPRKLCIQSSPLTEPHKHSPALGVEDALKSLQPPALPGFKGKSFTYVKPNLPLVVNHKAKAEVNPQKWLQKAALNIVKVAIKNVKPSLEVRKVRIAGTTYQVPAILNSKRSASLAIRWIIESARARKARSKLPFSDCLAEEILDAFQKHGKSRQKRDQLHGLASSNRAYIRFRWW